MLSLVVFRVLQSSGSVLVAAARTQEELKFYGVEGTSAVFKQSTPLPPAKSLESIWCDRLATDIIVETRDQKFLKYSVYYYWIWDRRSHAWRLLWKSGEEQLVAIRRVNHRLIALGINYGCANIFLKVRRLDEEDGTIWQSDLSQCPTDIPYFTYLSESQAVLKSIVGTIGPFVAEGSEDVWFEAFGFEHGGSMFGDIDSKTGDFVLGNVYKVPYLRQIGGHRDHITFLGRKRQIRLLGGKVYYTTHDRGMFTMSGNANTKINIPGNPVITLPIESINDAEAN